MGRRGSHVRLATARSSTSRTPLRALPTRQPGQQAGSKRLKSASLDHARSIAERSETRMNRSIARPSSPTVVTLELACHAGGRGFECRRSRKSPAKLTMFCCLAGHRRTPVFLDPPLIPPAIGGGGGSGAWPVIPAARHRPLGGEPHAELEAVSREAKRSSSTKPDSELTLEQ